jgi:hypothetical protein
MNLDWWRSRWRRTATETIFVGSRWQQAGRTLQDLMDALGCDEETALRFGVCGAPRRGESLDAWTRQVADHFGLDPARVQRVAELLRGRRG